MKTEEKATGRDLLAEAEEMLVAPSKNVKIRLLIIFNFIIGIPVLIFNIVTIVKNGNLNNPGRDWIMYPMLLSIMLTSGFYNLYHQVKGSSGNPRLVKTFTWLTIIMLQLVSIAAVQSNTNLALSFLWDVTISIIMIFITGVMLNRWAALVYGLFAFANMYFLATRIGLDFTYILTAPEGYGHPLPPKTIMQFVILWGLMMLISVLVAFSESGVIGNMLKVIPRVVARIRDAGDQKRKLEVENMRMGAELQVAQKLQMMVLPRPEELNACTELEIGATMQPASEVGGDYYDVLTKEDRTYIGVGDVTDHGLASGVVMLMVQSAFRILLEEPEPKLEHALAQLNALLYKNIQGRLQDTRNMTLCLLRHEKGRVDICGQHEKVILIRKSGTLEIHDTRDLGIYVGLLEDISHTINSMTLQIESGDQILLFTDGATEAENPAGEQYSEVRLAETFLKNREKPVQDIVTAIKADIIKWQAGVPLYDDITLLVLRRK